MININMIDIYSHFSYMRYIIIIAEMLLILVNMMIIFNSEECK